MAFANYLDLDEDHTKYGGSSGNQIVWKSDYVYYGKILDGNNEFFADFNGA